MAVQMLGIKTKFTDDQGRPLVGGSVHTYYAGTSLPQDTFSDPELTVPNTNPVKLDDTGSANIFLKGTYRVRVFDRKGKFIEEQDNVDQLATVAEVFKNKGGLNAANERIDALTSEVNSVKEKTLIVESIADLLAIKNPKDGLRVYVKSYRAGLGKGGGYFTYDSSKANVNDGGLVVNGWVRQLTTAYITPDMFGCYSDGVADDTVGMKNFAQAKHNYKIIKGSYSLAASPLFKIDGGSHTIDFGGSIIKGSSFAYAAIEIEVSGTCQDINITAGSYDGQELVNNYMNLYSVDSGSCDNISINCKGVIKNLSNSKNTRGTSGIFCSVISNTVTINDPIVENVHNINGAEGVASSSGVAVSNFKKKAVINDAIISGIYTSTGFDADGLVLFEAKGLATTGTALAIVNNPKIEQACGRGIKTQCSLRLRGLKLSLYKPKKGVILQAAWRAVDTQSADIDADDVSCEFGSDVFTTDADSTVFSVGGKPDGTGEHKIKNITISGDSKIRYLVALTANNCRSVHIDNIISIGNNTNLVILYPVRISVTDVISINNVIGKYNSYLMLVTYLVGRCEYLYFNNLASFDQVFDLALFDKVCINCVSLQFTGNIKYSSISKESRFYYATDGTTSGGIKYSDTSLAIPSWAKRYCHYDKGAVYSTYKDKILVVLGPTNIYQTILPTATIVPSA